MLKWYKNINNKVQTTIYKNQPINNLCANLEHPKSLKETIAYSQALHVKRIYSKNSESEAHINTIKDQFVKHGYEKTLLENQIKKVTKLDRSVPLAEQNKSKKALCLPLSVTYNRTLQKHWHLLKIDPTLEHTF